MTIIEHIKARGMTVAAVSRMSGISRQTIYSLQNDAHTPSVATLVAICRAVGVRPEVIRPELAE